MFLAEYPALYPQGLVTGYFGTLTKQAVIRFQREYGIDPVGRVGPITLSKINSLMSGGATSPVYGPSPWISGVSQSILNNQATISWTTNENTLAKVFYNTSPVTMNEGDINSVGFGSTNGWTARSDMTARTNHQVTITGLQPNTTYYYVIVATDLDGNVSVWNPNTTFRTTQ
jgi:peptidoglycan hydrolase-like protein with peptidoglycan-binding domain